MIMTKRRYLQNEDGMMIWSVSKISETAAESIPQRLQVQFVA
jgi:hypothetical protein